MSPKPVGPIVVGYDDTPAARAALRWTADYAAAVDGEVLVVYVSNAIAELELAVAPINTDAVRAGYEAHLQGDWTQLLRERDVRYRTKVAVGGVATELMWVAQSDHASMIVIGMTGRGILGQLMFGSAEHELLQHAARPVVAVPAAWQETAST